MKPDYKNDKKIAKSPLLLLADFEKSIGSALDNNSSSFTNLYFKGATTSFDVVSKKIAHSIQNRLLYLLAKFQGRATTTT